MKKQRFPPVARRILALIGAMIVLAAALAVPTFAYGFEPTPGEYTEYNLDCYNFISKNGYSGSFFDTRMFLRVYFKSDKDMRITFDIAPVIGADNVSVTVYAKDIYMTVESWANPPHGMPYAVLSLAVDGNEFFKVQNVVKSDKARIETWYCGAGDYSQYAGWMSWSGFNKEFFMQLCVDPSGVVNIACEERDDVGNTAISSADMRTILKGVFTSTKRYRTSCYTEGYNMGYWEGLNEGYTEGERQGLTVGREQGYESGYGAGYIDGEVEGFQDGQTDALSAKGTFKDLVFGIFDAPVRLIEGMLDFNIFDINVLSLVKTILTLGVTALIITFIVKFAKG